MRFPFQHIHWARHKRHNREFNLKLIYWWNVIRIPMKTNKSTWHWEKDQLVKTKATSTATHMQGKSYTNWRTPAELEWNAPCAILETEMKLFEVKMLMAANICSFHKKQTPDFCLWNPALAPHFCFPLFCKSTKSPARSSEKWYCGTVIDQPSLTRDVYISLN